MSRASETFNSSILDAEALLGHFDLANKQSPDSAEVLKRAGLVMAMTAWETYVEDRIVEAMQTRLRAVSGSSIGKFVANRLDNELKQFHNPTPEKTKRLFLDYLELDITESWSWPGIDPVSAKKYLNELLAKRGDAVHRSKANNGGPPQPHLVRRDDLEKAIRFLNGLVQATDKALFEL